MLLTITMTAGPAEGAPGETGYGPEPATDLGFLLHKNPGRVQSFELAVGTAHVFYPQATPTRCTAALLLEVDPIALVRGRSAAGGADGFSLGQYVNDRPYAASSMLAVALGRVFRTAMTGRCEARPELAARAVPLEIGVPALPCRGGAGLAARLFEPLGWQVRATPIPLDESFPAWGDSRYVDLRADGVLRLADALNHLYVLLPVLDDSKHYWVSPDEVDKLVRAGSGWLAGHPEKGLITERYLVHKAGLQRSALARLAEVDDARAEDFDNAVPPEQANTERADTERVDAAQAEPRGPSVPLAALRRAAVLGVLREAGVHRVADLGCGEGAFTADLLADPTFTEIVAADVSSRALQIAERRLGLDQMSPRNRDRLRLIQSALTYRDQRLAGLDAVVLIEVIEHVDPPRLPALERTVFTDAAPGMVVVTTPNREHNARFEFLASGQMRHYDHRFEWTRAEFASWAGRVAAERGYDVRFLPVGDDDAKVGPPTQLAVFTRRERSVEVGA